MKLPGLDDEQQLAALFVYVMMMLAVFLGLTLVVTAALEVKGVGTIGALAGICVTAASGVLGVRAARRSRDGGDGRG